MNCMNCGGTHDVIDFQRGEERIVLCADCRFRLLSGQKATRQVGRPSLGVTKKVSLTLPQSAWERLDRKAGGNRSDYLRRLVERDMWSQDTWSNNACLGYAILGAKKLGFNDKEIEGLVRAIYYCFDEVSVEEAKKVYEESPY